MPAPSDFGDRTTSDRRRTSTRHERRSRRMTDTKAAGLSDGWTELPNHMRAVENGGRDISRTSHRRGRSCDVTSERTKHTSKALPPPPSYHATDSSASRSISRRASRDLPPLPGYPVYIDDSTGSSDSSQKHYASVRMPTRSKRASGPPSALETRVNLSRSYTASGVVGYNKPMDRPRLSSRAQTPQQAKGLPALPAHEQDRRRRPAQTPKPLNFTPTNTNHHPAIATANATHGNQTFKAPDSPDKSSLWSEDTSEIGHNWVAQSTPAMIHHKSGSTSTFGSTDSKSSSSRLSGFMKKPVVQKVIHALNAPANMRPPQERRSSRQMSPAKTPVQAAPRSVSTSSQMRQPAVPVQRSANLIHETTASLVRNYKLLRKSIVISSEVDPVQLQQQGREYLKVMHTYLQQFASLPMNLHHSPYVKHLREKLEQTANILEAVLAGADSEQALAYLDATIINAKDLLKSSHEVLLSHATVLTRSPSLEEESDIEYEVASPAVAELIEKTNGLESAQSVRRMRSSLAAVSPTIVPDMPDTPRARDYDQKAARPLILQDVYAPQSAEQARNLNAISESYAALRNAGLVSQEKRYMVPRPDDTRYVNYGQDGMPIAMSTEAIVKEVIRCAMVKTENPPGESFIDIIFTNFRYWWTPLKFFNLLWEQYAKARNLPRKIAVMRLVADWITTYWMTTDLEVLKPCHRFLISALYEHIVPKPFILDLVKRLHSYETGSGNTFGDKSNAWDLEKMPFRIADIARDMPLIRGAYKNVRLLQFNNHESCEEFARQLTLKESALYLDLNSAEIVQCFVIPGSNPRAEFKLRKQCEFSTRLKRWAAFSVLKESDPSKRAKTFAFLARLAEVCIRLRNFSSAHSIYNGLESVHIDSLPRTKAELSQKGARRFSFISKFFADNRDNSEQVTAMPTVPLMAIYAGKLQRLKELKSNMYTPSKVDDSLSLINLSLFRGATRVIFAIQSNQTPYNFKAHAPMQSYLDHIFSLVPTTDDQIHEIFVDVKTLEQTEPKPNPSFVTRLRSGSLSMGTKSRAEH